MIQVLAKDATTIGDGDVILNKGPIIIINTYSWLITKLTCHDRAPLIDFPQAQQPPLPMSTITG